VVPARRAVCGKSDMSRSHFLSMWRLSRERRSLATRQASRHELERFFAECLNFINGRQRQRDHAGDPITEGIAAFAFEKFGSLASNVLQHWGIDSPEELERCFYQYLKACGSRGCRRGGGFSESDALKALFRGDFWP
jgi:hypothetical protein